MYKITQMIKFIKNDQMYLILGIGNNKELSVKSKIKDLVGLVGLLVLLAMFKDRIGGKLVNSLISLNSSLLTVIKVTLDAVVDGLIMLSTGSQKMAA